MNHIVENVLHGSRVRLDTHMEGWSYHHLQDGHFGKFALGLQQPVTRPWEVLGFRNGEAQAKDRGYMGCRGGVFIIERRRKLSSGTGSSSSRSTDSTRTSICQGPDGLGNQVFPMCSTNNINPVCYLPIGKSIE